MQGRLLLERSGDAAFACDAGGRIVAWNSAAALLLGREPEEALGALCHEVLGGRDVFGNRYCGDACPLRAILGGEEPVQSFDMDVAPQSGPAIRVRTTILVLAHAEGDLLIHLLQPLEATAAAEASALTAREAEVLRLLAEGVVPECIAETLGISVHTARTHIQHIHAKLEAHTTLEAVARARREGLL